MEIWLISIIVALFFLKFLLPIIAALQEAFTFAFGESVLIANQSSLPIRCCINSLTKKKKRKTRCCDSHFMISHPWAVLLLPTKYDNSWIVNDKCRTLCRFDLVHFLLHQNCVYHCSGNFQLHIWTSIILLCWRCHWFWKSTNKFQVQIWMDIPKHDPLYALKLELAYKHFFPTNQEANDLKSSGSSFVIRFV